METEYNFSQLPEVVWVNVMSYLSLKDRYHLAITCHALSDIFYHPSLWHSAKLVLVGGSSNFQMSRTFIPTNFTKMIDRFGHLFQHLTIRIIGHINNFDDTTRDLIAKLGEVCRLETLTLEAGTLISNFHVDGIVPFRSDILAILAFVHNAFRLKKFHLVSWPMYPILFNKSDLNIFQALMDNKKIEGLEALSLFWNKDASWSERKPLLPSPSYTETVIRHFRNISHLSLRSPMMSTSLVLELASPGRTQVKLLEIFVTFSANDTEFKIPDISSESWLALKAQSPKMEVVCTIMSRVPNMELSNLLKPELPLTEITFLKYSHCDGPLLASLADKYRENLLKFACFCEITGTALSSQLVSFVSKCKNLCDITYHGDIICSTIEMLAEMRGRKWNSFTFVKSKISSLEEFSNEDDDAVLQRNAQGDLIIVSLMRFHLTDAHRNQRIMEMIFNVSKILGCTWKPI